MALNSGSRVKSEEGMALNLRNTCIVPCTKARRSKARKVCSETTKVQIINIESASSTSYLSPPPSFFWGHSSFLFFSSGTGVRSLAVFFFGTKGRGTNTATIGRRTMYDALCAGNADCKREGGQACATTRAGRRAPLHMQCTVSGDNQ